MCVCACVVFVHVDDIYIIIVLKVLASNWLVKPFFIVFCYNNIIVIKSLFCNSKHFRCLCL